MTLHISFDGDVAEGHKWLPWAKTQLNALSAGGKQPLFREMTPAGNVTVTLWNSSGGQRIRIKSNKRGSIRMLEYHGFEQAFTETISGESITTFLRGISLTTGGPGNVTAVAIPPIANSCSIVVGRAKTNEYSQIRQIKTSYDEVKRLANYLFDNKHGSMLVGLLGGAYPQDRLDQRAINAFRRTVFTTHPDFLRVSEVILSPEVFYKKDGNLRCICGLTFQSTTLDLPATFSQTTSPTLSVEDLPLIKFDVALEALFPIAVGFENTLIVENVGSQVVFEVGPLNYSIEIPSGALSVPVFDDGVIRYSGEIVDGTLRLNIQAYQESGRLSIGRPIEATIVDLRPSVISDGSLLDYISFDPFLGYSIAIVYIQSSFSGATAFQSYKKDFLKIKWIDGEMQIGEVSHGVGSPYSIVFTSQFDSTNPNRITDLDSSWEVIMTSQGQEIKVGTLKNRLSFDRDFNILPTIGSDGVEVVFDGEDVSEYGIPSLFSKPRTKNNPSFLDIRRGSVFIHPKTKVVYIQGRSGYQIQIGGTILRETSLAPETYNVGTIDPLFGRLDPLVGTGSPIYRSIEKPALNRNQNTLFHGEATKVLDTFSNVSVSGIVDYVSSNYFRSSEFIVFGEKSFSSGFGEFTSDMAEVGIRDGPSQTSVFFQVASFRTKFIWLPGIENEQDGLCIFEVSGTGVMALHSLRFYFPLSADATAADISSMQSLSLPTSLGSSVEAEAIRGTLSAIAIARANDADETLLWEELKDELIAAMGQRMVVLANNFASEELMAFCMSKGANFYIVKDY